MVPSESSFLCSLTYIMLQCEVIGSHLSSLPILEEVALTLEEVRPSQVWGALH